MQKLFEECQLCGKQKLVKNECKCRVCPKCGENYSDDNNLEFIEEIGICLSCEHVMSEVYGD